MEEIIPRYFELSIIHSWLKGKTRDEIAQEFGKSQGTVSNIIAKIRNGWGNYDADSMRELAKELRERDITPDNCACGFRVFNILQNLKIPETEIEKFLEMTYGFSQKMGIKADILNDALLQFVKISDELPFSEIPNYLHKIKEEKEQSENKKKKVKGEIQTLEKEKVVAEEKLSSSLKNASTTLVNLDIFVSTKSELDNYGIPLEDINKFVRCIKNIKNYSNYNPFEIIENLCNLEKMKEEREDKIKRIKELRKLELEYIDKLDLNSIKLTKLDELEKTGFGIQDLKKLKRTLIEISIEHNVNLEQTKEKFFTDLDNYENNIASENKVNKLLEQIITLQKQIESKRLILCCQELIGPFLRNLINYGIQENNLISIQLLLDKLYYESNISIEFKEIQQQIAKDLSTYSNLKLAITKLKHKIETNVQEDNLSNKNQQTYELDHGGQFFLYDSIF